MDSETHDPIDLQTKELRYAIFFLWPLDKILILDVMSGLLVNKT